jgi:hypothetical protein
MDIQEFIDSMNEESSRLRSCYHLTLGELSNALDGVNPDFLVVFDGGLGANSLDSYRGYYTDLAIDVTGETKTVAVWRDIVKEALNTTFFGYKGGEFPATPDTPLWMAEYGVASGVAIIDIKVVVDLVVLVTKNLNR